MWESQICRRVELVEEKDKNVWDFIEINEPRTGKVEIIAANQRAANYFM
jgi:hypothetical protein